MLRRIFLCGAMVFTFSLVSIADQGEEEEGEVDVVIVEEVSTPAVQTEEKKEPEEVKAEEVKEEEKTEESAKENVEEGEKAEETVAEPAGEPAKPAEEEVKAQTEKQEEVPAPVAEAVPAVNEAKETKPEEVKEVKEDAHKDTHIVRSILMWLPNRLIDLSDIISADIGAGSEFALEFGITKFFSFGGANGEKYFLMKGYERQMGGGYDSGWNYQTAFLNSEKRFVEDTFGTVKKYYKTRKPYGMLDHTNFVYEEHIRDIWALEARVGWLAVLGIQLHPVELADFIAGIFFIDIKKDDLK